MISIRAILFILTILFFLPVLGRNNLSKQEQLEQAYLSNDIKKFEQLCKKTDKAESQQSDLLITIVKDENIDFAKIYLNYIDTIFNKDSNNASPLMWAVDAQNIELIEITLPKSRRPFSKGIIFKESPKGHFGSVMSLAASSHNIEILTKLVESGGDVNEKELDEFGNETNWTPLWSAISREDTAIVEYLITNGADVNISIDDYSPLMFAVEKNNVAIVNILINNEANIYQKYINGKDAIHIAAQQGNMKIISLFENIDSAICLNSDVLAIAYLQKHDALLKYLLSHNIDYKDVCIDNKYSSLQYALFSKLDINSLEYFEQKGMPLQCKCSTVMGQYGYSVLLFPEERCSDYQLQFLKQCLELGCDPLLKTIGENPIEKAVLINDQKYVDLLLSHLPKPIAELIEELSNVLYTAVVSDNAIMLDHLIQTLSVATENRQIASKALKYAKEKRKKKLLDIFAKYNL